MHHIASPPPPHPIKNTAEVDPARQVMMDGWIDPMDTGDPWEGGGDYKAG